MDSKKHILIIDDDDMVRETIEAMLYSEDYRISYIGDPTAVIGKLDEIVPDVMLLDVMMPGMNGFELCKKIRDKRQYAHIPIIMLTAINSKDAIVDGLEAGADEFLNKPVRGAELRARIVSMLRIKSQYDELRNSLALVEDLTHMIVHDMRNPLSAILMSASIMRTYSMEERTERRIEVIEKSGKRLKKFIDELLLIAREKYDSLILNREVFALEEVIRDIYDDFRYMIEMRKIDLQIETPVGRSFRFFGDRGLIHRMLENCILNAIKYSPSMSRITVGIEEQEDEEIIRIIDEGEGIPDEDKERIFNRYEIGSLKRKGVVQTGIGLSFSKMVAEAHGIEIRVEDNSPKGSIFSFIINKKSAVDAIENAMERSAG